jgi:hypothetical protein
VVGRLTPSKDGKPRIHNTRPAHPDLNIRTRTPNLEHPNLTTPTCKPNLNTAPTCATSITNKNSNLHSSNSTSSIPYIIPTPTSISSLTPSTSASTSPPLSTPSPPLDLPHHEHFSPPAGGGFIAFQENSSAPLTCEPGGSASNETCARCRCNLNFKKISFIIELPVVSKLRCVSSQGVKKRVRVCRRLRI